MFADLIEEIYNVFFEGLYEIHLEIMSLFHSKHPTLFSYSRKRDDSFINCLLFFLTILMLICG